MTDLWPVTVFKARYSGVYEGGKWVAFNEMPTSDKLEGAMTSDVPCATFYATYRKFKPIGVGATADDAVDDLVRQLESDSHRFT